MLLAIAWELWGQHKEHLTLAQGIWDMLKEVCEGPNGNWGNNIKKMWQTTGDNTNQDMEEKLEHRREQHHWEHTCAGTKP